MLIPKPRRLSKKKVRKSITLPEYLDEWINRYLKHMRKQQLEKNENIKKELRSYSSFVANILEQVMHLFLKGKSLEDLELATDRKTKDFYEKITFRALTIYYEFIVRINKYRKFDLKSMLNVFMMYQNFFTNGGKSISEDEAIIALERLKNFMINNNTTKDVTIERSGNKYIFQYFGIYPNMHYDFSKWIAGILGFLGVKIERITHSNNYTRMDFVVTDIFRVNEANLGNRKELFEYNTEFFTNFNRILEDEDDLQLWIRINQSKLPIISFKNIEDGLLLIREIVNNLNKWSSPREFKFRLLDLFKKLRWINQINKTKLSFQLLIEKHTTEYNIIKTVLSELKINFEDSGNTLFLK